MDEQHATPDPTVEAPAADTPPPAEPVDEPAPEPAADQSALGPIGQAEYTRATQTAAAIKRELGLPKSATQAEVIAALQAARAAPEADAEEDDVEEDPRIVAERERRIAAELRVTTAVYGEQFAADGLALLNAARTSDDLDELFTMLAAFRDAHAPAPAPTSAASAPTDAPPAPEQNIDLSEGDRASRQSEPAPAGRRETGATSAVRGIFESLGIASRPPAQ